jgi:fructose-1,6-bisphosphatase II
VLSCAALKCVGGDFQGILHVANEEDAAAAKQAGFTNKRRVLRIDDLVKSENAMFAATGVTRSDILEGVQYRHGGATTHSIVMRRQSGTVRFIQANHSFDRKPHYL